MPQNLGLVGTILQMLAILLLLTQKTIFISNALVVAPYCFPIGYALEFSMIIAYNWIVFGEAQGWYFRHKRYLSIFDKIELRAFSIMQTVNFSQLEKIISNKQGFFMSLKVGVLRIHLNQKSGGTIRWLSMFLNCFHTS